MMGAGLRKVGLDNSLHELVGPWWESYGIMGFHCRHGNSFIQPHERAEPTEVSPLLLGADAHGTGALLVMLPAQAWRLPC